MKLKRIALATSVLLSLMTAHSARASESKHAHPSKKSASETSNKRSFAIHVADGDWGNVQPQEIETILNRITSEMLTRFPDKKIDPIIVSPSRRGPVVLYQKGPEHQYQIFLSARDRNWGEYIYEFSHELFHVLANYEYHAPPHVARHQWFEEMLCEAVSLYNLKKMSLTWEQSPPRAEWASYGPELARFTERAFSDPHRRLPDDTPFAQWFEKNGPSLVGNPYLRKKNELVAMMFLPLLERNPDWRAVSFLNLDRAADAASFRDYLARWYLKTPTSHRDLIGQAMALFHYHAPPPNARLPMEPEQPDIAWNERAGASPVGAEGPRGADALMN